MKYAKGYYDSMYGRIESSWIVEDGVTQYAFNIPGNTSALLYLPASSIKDIKESGKSITKKNFGIRIVNQDNGFVILELLSGNYLFEVNKRKL